jgi:hypothetical protein
MAQKFVNSPWHCCWKVYDHFLHYSYSFTCVEQRVIAGKLIRLTQKLAIQWHLMTETFTACTCILCPSSDLKNFWVFLRTCVSLCWMSECPPLYNFLGNSLSVSMFNHVSLVLSCFHMICSVSTWVLYSCLFAFLRCSYFDTIHHYSWELFSEVGLKCVGSEVIKV